MKFIRSLTSGQATTLNATGTPTPAIRVRHCRFSKGSSSNTASTGLTTSERPIAMPANQCRLTRPSSIQRRNSTSANRMQPLILVKTNVLVTDSVQNIASSSAGSATEVSGNLNSRTSRQAAAMMANVLIRMNQLRAANSLSK